MLQVFSDSNRQTWLLYTMSRLGARRGRKENVSYFSTYVSAPSRAFRPNAIDLCRQCRKRVLHSFEPAVGQFLLIYLSLGIFGGRKNGFGFGTEKEMNDQSTTTNSNCFHLFFLREIREKVVPTRYITRKGSKQESKGDS